MDDRNNYDVLSLFESKELVKLCAPMVRYSKLQFRTLVREYGCDLCYTPMILADSFCLSDKARQNEFITNNRDFPLITQLAANTVHDFVGAAYMIAPFCNGVDLNCGCPQRWAKQLGIGCALLSKPELIADMVQQCRNTIPKPFTVSVKIRILKDLRKTVEICRQLEQAKISYLAVHARTSSETTQEINVEALKLIIENVQCPVVVNGGITNLEECYQLKETTNCKGVMVANGILKNPTLFSGSPETTLECVQKWLDICYNSTLNEDSYCVQKVDFNIPERPPNLTFQCFHHHLVFMLEKVLPRAQRRIFNNLQTFVDVLQFLNNYFNMRPRLYSDKQFRSNCILKLDYENRGDLYLKLGGKGNNSTTSYNYENSDCNYFQSNINNCDLDSSNSDFNISDIFNENGLSK